MDRPDIVKMLIAHPKINPNVVVSKHSEMYVDTSDSTYNVMMFQGNEGSTPLTLAVAKCSKEMVSMILSLPDTDPNLK